MRILFIIGLIIAALLSLLVTALNPERVHIELGAVQFDATLGLTLVCVFVIGLLAGVLWRVQWVAELLSERGRLRRALRIAESRARADAVAGDRPRSRETTG